MKKSLKIIYDGPLDKEFDEEIKSLMFLGRWRCWASGFNLETNERDLAFDKSEENN